MIGAGTMRLTLLEAVEYEQLDLVRSLVENKADVNSNRCINGKRHPLPLTQAVQGWSAHVVRLLLRFKADPELCTDAEEPEDAALISAISARHTTYTTLSIVNAFTTLSIVNALLEAKADVDLPTESRDTALTTAVKQTEVKPEVISVLLKAKADVDFANKDAETALMIAAQNGGIEAARLLLEANADVHFVGKYGATPLMRAAYGRSKGHPEVVSLLLSHKADPDARDEEGLTALEIAHNERNDLNNMTCFEGFREDNDAGKQNNKEVIAILTSAASAPHAGR